MPVQQCLNLLSRDMMFWLLFGFRLQFFRYRSCRRVQEKELLVGFLGDVRCCRVMGCSIDNLQLSRVGPFLGSNVLSHLEESEYKGNVVEPQRRSTM